MRVPRVDYRRSARHREIRRRIRADAGRRQYEADEERPDCRGLWGSRGTVSEVKNQELGLAGKDISQQILPCPTGPPRPAWPARPTSDPPGPNFRSQVLASP